MLRAFHCWTTAHPELHHCWGTLLKWSAFSAPKCTKQWHLWLQISKDEEELIKKRLEVCNPLHCTVSVAHHTPSSRLPQACHWPDGAVPACRVCKLCIMAPVTAHVALKPLHDAGLS